MMTGVLVPSSVKYHRMYMDTVVHEVDLVCFFEWVRVKALKQNINLRFKLEKTEYIIEESRWLLSHTDRVEIKILLSKEDTQDIVYIHSTSEYLTSALNSAEMLSRFKMYVEIIKHIPYITEEELLTEFTPKFATLESSDAFYKELKNNADIVVERGIISRLVKEDSTVRDQKVRKQENRVKRYYQSYLEELKALKDLEAIRDAYTLSPEELEDSVTNIIDFINNLQYDFIETKLYPGGESLGIVFNNPPLLNIDNFDVENKSLLKRLCNIVQPVELPKRLSPLELYQVYTGELKGYKIVSKGKVTLSFTTHTNGALKVSYAGHPAINGHSSHGCHGSSIDTLQELIYNRNIVGIIIYYIQYFTTINIVDSAGSLDYYKLIKEEESYE